MIELALSHWIYMYKSIIFKNFTTAAKLLFLLNTVIRYMYFRSIRNKESRSNHIEKFYTIIKLLVLWTPTRY